MLVPNRLGFYTIFDFSRRQTRASIPAHNLPHGPMPTLLHYPLCPFSRSIRLLLAERGVEVAKKEERPWDWRPEFLEVNPAGTLPVLAMDDEVALCGVYPISEYFGETGAGPAAGRGFDVFPGSSAARAEARRLVDWFQNKFHMEVSERIVDEKIYRRFRRSSDSPDMDGLRASRANLRYHLRYVGYLAEHRNWLAGEDLSFADLAAAAHLSVIDYLGDVPWEESEAAKAWYARVKSRPSFRELLADRLPGLAPPEAYADLDF
jgi:glutathione S-transferase